MKQEIPVLLLTGYLGSGKTTLLNRILSNKKGIKFAVIVNDIGEVNIDAALIQQGGIVNQKDDSLVALQNGCICCTLKMDLVQQLQDLIELQRFDYIVIEASGICEPAPIAQTICSIPQMAPQVTEKGYPRLDCIVTVVDALRMRDEFGSGLDLTRQNIDEEDIENLVIQQIEFCNIVLLNKASEVTPDELGRIRQIVRTLQPKAAIIDTNFSLTLTVLPPLLPGFRKWRNTTMKMTMTKKKNMNIIIMIMNTDMNTNITITTMMKEKPKSTALAHMSITPVVPLN